MPVATVAVSPATATVTVGRTMPLTATTKDASGNVLTGRVVTWSSSDTALATVSATGVVTGVAAGGPVAIAATSEGRSSTATITVIPIPVATVAVMPATASVTVGRTVPLTATTKDAGGNVLTGRVVTWSSSDTTLATVSATGVVTGVAAGGPVTITATSEGQSGSAAITVTAAPVATVAVTPATASVAVARAVPLTATTKDASGNVLTGRVVTWASGDTTLATVSASGVVTGVAAGGPVTVTATSEGHSGTAAITVVTVPVATVAVAPATASVPAGQTVPLTATTRDAGGNVLTGRVVTWASGNTALATVSATGVVTGVAAGGPVTITATSEGQSGSAAITVTAVPVATVSVAPATASVAVGQTVPLSATTKDASGNVLTGRVVTWASGNTSLATVSTAGVVTGVAAGGPVAVTATSEGQSGSAAVTVTAQAPPSLTLTASPTSITTGQSSTLTWSTSGATSCTASGGWSGTQATSGSQIVSPTTTTTYTLGCTGPGGTTSKSVTVTVGTGGGGSYVYPLKVGPTGRYLVDQTGKPFLMVGDAAWSLIAQLSDQDADTYLANRQQLGFSLVLANLLEHLWATHAPNDIYNIPPFTGKVFTTPNEAYFAHADYIIQSAAQKGLVVLLDPTYLGFGCGDEGWCAEITAASDSDMLAWGQFLGKRYGGYDNIIWVIGADTDPSSVKGKLQDVVTGIQQYDTRHLFTAHNGRTQMAIAPWSGASWLTVNDTYTDGLEYTYAQTAYAVTPAMPFFLIEAIYENMGAFANDLRAQSYWTILSGGFGHVFGNCPVWNFEAPPAPCTQTNWQAQLNSQGALNMQHLAKLFTGRHWASLVPDLGHSVLTAGYSSGGDYATAAYAADSSSIIAYLPSVRAVTVSGTRLAGATETAWWYNPGTGVATMIGTYPTTGTQTFTPPSGGDGDWVLVVDSQAFGFAAPGS